ncbi:uncharacterized protein LOC143460103 [Clavelina lepadiformis]|uniref:uncharacterized protein LOC143460103 n=1 Tax=Clavelina lepadiformis TaxID=159417 RepID=UPI0040429078
MSSANNLLMLACLVSSLSCAHTKSQRMLKLGMHKPTLGSIKVLNYEPTPETFYEDFIRSSTPVLIRTNNPSWHKYFSSWARPSFLQTHINDMPGRAYNRPIWTQDYPGEVRLNFTDFFTRPLDEKLYWDSTFPLDNSLFKHMPLPLPLSCLQYSNWIESAVLLYTKVNSTSPFHHDGAENFFFQISGKKTWLIANYSEGNKAYADLYDVQPGLSPINPEQVDLDKYPLAADINFYKVTVEPGDMLYVPEHWWHHVTSFDPPIISVNLWSEVFELPLSSEKRDIANHTKVISKFIRESSSPSIKCMWQHRSIADVSQYNWKDISTLSESATEPLRNYFLLHFSSDISGCFYAVNSITGTILWNYTISTDAGSTPVVSADEKTVYFADEDSKLYAFHTESGNLLWKIELSDAIVASLRLNKIKDILYAATIDGWVYAFNITADGRPSLLWKSGPFPGEIWSSPFIHKPGLIICIKTTSTEDPSVYMLHESNGSVMWSHTMGRPVFASPVVDHESNNLFVLDVENYLNVIDMQTGKSLWTFDIGDGVLSSPVLSSNGNILYIVTASGQVMCLDALKLDIIWKIVVEKSTDIEVVSSPLLTEKWKLLYVAIGYRVMALDAENGKAVWEFSADAEFMSSPRLDKYGTLYIGGMDNKLYALNGLKGTVQWSVLSLGPIVSSVTIFDRYVEESSYGGLM